MPTAQRSCEATVVKYCGEKEEEKAKGVSGEKSIERSSKGQQNKRGGVDVL